MIEQLVALLADNRRFLVVSHESPDGDAIASTLALANALREQGNRITSYNVCYTKLLRKLVEFDFSGFVVEMSLEIAGIPVFLVGGCQNCRLQRLDKDLTIDTLFLDHLVDDVIEVDSHFGSAP